MCGKDEMGMAMYIYYVELQTRTHYMIVVMGDS